MASYETMFILNPNLGDQQKKEVFSQLQEAITKNQGQVNAQEVWSEKRKLAYPIKKFQEGIYYLMNFNIEPQAIVKLKQVYALNENIIRLLITRTDN